MKSVILIYVHNITHYALENKFVDENVRQALNNNLNILFLQIYFLILRLIELNWAIVVSL